MGRGVECPGITLSAFAPGAQLELEVLLDRMEIELKSPSFVLQDQRGQQGEVLDSPSSEMASGLQTEVKDGAAGQQVAAEDLMVYEPGVLS